MSSTKGPDKKTKKLIKRLTVWIRKIQSYQLFEIGRNAKHSLQELMELPISAALHNSSIEHEALFESRTSADDFYHHINNKLTELDVRKMLRHYVGEIIKLLKNYFSRASFEIAIDKTDQIYWGEKENLYVTGGKRKSSTNYAFRYLTAAIVVQGIEFVIYARPLTKDDRNDALLVEECINEINKLGINVSRILLDREFYNSKIILVANVKNIEYIIPVVKNSRFTRLLDELKKENKHLPRIIENYGVDDQVANLVIYEDKNSKGETEIFGFITNIETDEIQKDVYAIADFYRRRWVIENANKFQDKFNISTNSRSGIARYFFFMLTVLLHNFWVLVSLLANVFSLKSISINIIKNILLRVFSISSPSRYKHAQLQLWMSILV